MAHTELGRKTGWVEAFSLDATSQLIDRLQDPRPIVPTPLPSMNKLFGKWGCHKGIPRGEFVVIGAASNGGKTIGALMHIQQALWAGEKTALISLEEKDEDLLYQFQRQATKDRIPSSAWTPETWKHAHSEELIASSMNWLRNEQRAELWIKPQYDTRLDRVLYEVERAVRHGATYIVVDHVQLIEAEQQSITDSSSAVMVELRKIAFHKQNPVTIVALSQLNREASKNYDRTPIIQDLWGGTPMESTPSVVMLMDHSRYELPYPDKLHIARTWWGLGKNRMGPKNIWIPVEIDYLTLSVREALDDEIDEWPDRGKA